MIKVLIGIMLGGSLAMIFPEHAAESYEFVRETINTFARSVVENTDQNLVDKVIK